MSHKGSHRSYLTVMHCRWRVVWVEASIVARCQLCSLFKIVQSLDGKTQTWIKNFDTLR